MKLLLYQNVLLNFLFFNYYESENIFKIKLSNFSLKNWTKESLFLHVTPWLIHVNGWQNPLKWCKVISLQLIKINEKKKKDRWTWALAYKLNFENFPLNFHNSWSLLCPYFELSSCTSLHAFLELCILSFHNCCYNYCCFVVDIFALVLVFYFTFFWVTIM